ncbi:MAG: glycoside hydrolase family 3 C-terminal domain-containing protein [Prevotellaceae bacterium]|nr:glycoside hydrolase family 3 C-terminal domain-containing protein [Prevotellaceae bacterium]
MKKNCQRILLFALFPILAGCQSTQFDFPFQNPKLALDDRVADLVSRMTLDEKVAQMQNTAPAITRLGVPAFDWWNECLHGVARSGLATVFPQAIGMAAMWDEAEMFAIASIISDEARAKHSFYAARDKRGMNQGLTFWTPNINLFRDPRWGRGQETYGEDPYLTGELAVPFVKGLQGDHPQYLKLVATVKHFAVHSGPESTRRSANVLPSEYDLWDTYLPHFKKAVEQAHPYSAMCAYQRLNNLPCCGSLFLSDLLRNQWGFDGYIVSDCGGVSYFHEHHRVTATPEESSVMSVKAGTDLNCGTTYANLASAVAKGMIAESEIDVSVRRLMKARFKLGQFDSPDSQPYTKIPLSTVDCKQHREAALNVARKSLVLLKNDRNILPFSKDVKKVAVVGPNANDPEALVGNYSGSAPYLVTPFDAIREKLPKAEVVFALGCTADANRPFLQPVAPRYFYTDSTMSAHGLKAQYFANKDRAGTPELVRNDSLINVCFYMGTPFADKNLDLYSARWTGVIVPPVTGEYALGAEGFSGYEVLLDNQTIAKWDGIYDPERNYKRLRLEAGKPYAIRADYFSENSSQSVMRLLWEIPEPDAEANALRAAAEADLVVLCMGINISFENEGRDRKDIQLPEPQRRLISKILATGKPTVMVLNSGSALALDADAEKIPAIIQAWYPGQSGGTAIADAIFGDYNPAGRLPVTFYRSIDQLPDYASFDMEGRTYRYFRQQPQFEFGHGLSYTSFAYEAVSAPAALAPGKPAEITIKITNTGIYDGDEVAQLYVSLPAGKYRVPVRSLQAFKRIHLKAGESRTLSFTLAPEQFQTRDENGMPVTQSGKAIVSAGGKQPDKKAIADKQAVQFEITI